ncbi:serine hydrolase [Enterococcus camelliae]|uniref:Serine hydrolase n=1 Tax=Enterococcus camelliae TaxID=453959 RepID=A0ABW5TJR3_9ENTE
MKKKWLKMLCLGAMFVGLGKAAVVQADENAGFVHPEYMDLLDQLIASENKYGLTGVQLAVYKDGQLLKNTGYGYTNNYYDYYDEYGNFILTNAKVLPLSERNVVTTETLFDMASNTKMYATVYAMQKLISDQAPIPETDHPLTLATKISEIFPEFLNEANENHWKEDITVGLVLSHYAGFSPDPQYHNENYDKDDGIKNGKNDLFSQEKQTTFNMVMKTPVTTKPGTAWAYSDVDMMLAGFIVEHVTGQDLDTYVKENFYQPLGLNRLTFNPLNFGFQTNEIASTELHGNTRDGRVIFQNARMDVITGQVHDEKAFYSMGGVSGHAGLFGTAQQVAYLAQAMVNNGTLNGVHLFDPEVIEQFTKPTAGLATQAEGGWRRKSETGGAASWFSKFAPAGTVGHTGWTGTNTMIDFQNHLTLSLMTNARNTPIMGPDPNVFYTANSNISSYGTVSEFVYRALGLGNDTYDTPEKVLEKMIVDELSDIDLASATVSKRNVIRSLLDTLAMRAATDSQASTYQQSNLVQTTSEALKATEAYDLRFLVVTKSLDEGIEKGNNLLPETYTKSSYQKVLALVKKGENLIARNDYTQAQVDELALQLQHALAELVNITQLQLLVEQTTYLNQKEYTKSSWQKVAIALQAAQKELTNETANQAAVDAATTALKTAIDSLVKPGDKTLLEQAVKTATSIDRNAYTVASYANLEAALAQAQTILADGEAAQAAIDEATQKLTGAVEQLVKVSIVVNKDVLRELLGKIEDLMKNKALYTSESWQQVESVFQKAIPIRDSDKATQEDVDQVVQQLQLAIKQLKKVPAKNATEQSKQNSNQANQNSKQTNQQSAIKTSSYLPKTGFTKGNSFILIGVVVIAGVLGIFGYRRKNHK